VSGLLSAPIPTKRPFRKQQAVAQIPKKRDILPNGWKQQKVVVLKVSTSWLEIVVRKFMK
jgi:hypothetical protein